MCLSDQVNLSWLTINGERSCVVNKVFLATFIALVAGPAYAGSATFELPLVPEIDALSGLAALAAIGGALTLIWERRRRR